MWKEGSKGSEITTLTVMIDASATMKNGLQPAIDFLRFRTKVSKSNREERRAQDMPSSERKREGLDPNLVSSAEIVCCT